MNRRGFLKFLGGAAVASLSASRAVAQTFSIPGVRYSMPETEGVEALTAAIERLFPAGAIRGASTSYSYFDDKNLMLMPHEEAPYGAARVVFQTFALGYHAEDENERLHRALYLSMFRTWEMIAERPENRNAVLVWRQTPSEERGQSDFNDPELVTLRLRAGLLQQSWRRALSVEPRLFGAKPEGMRVRLL